MSSGADFMVSLGASNFPAPASAVGIQIVTAARSLGDRDLEVTTSESKVAVSFVLRAIDEDEAQKVAHAILAAVDREDFDWQVGFLRSFVS